MIANHFHPQKTTEALRNLLLMTFDLFPLVRPPGLTSSTPPLTAGRVGQCKRGGARQLVCIQQLVVQQHKPAPTPFHKVLRGGVGARGCADSLHIYIYSQIYIYIYATKNKNAH